ncbi:MAG: ferritin-like domain-containing protein [Minicystis sp.]
MIADLAPRTSGTLLEAEYRALDAGLARTRSAPLVFDARAYDPRSVARARGLWLERMENEYSSTTVFSQLAGQLMEANATLDATAVTLRMAQDELRHAELCAAVVRAMGGEARRARETSIVAIARHPGVSDEERAIRNVVFTTCLSEMNSVSYFVAGLETMTDPCLRDVTRRLLADEVLHGRFGFAYLEAWSPWLDANPGARASIGTYLAFAFAVVEREFTRGETKRFTPTPDDDALGVLPPGLSAETFRRTMIEAVVPGLERFGIPAEDAWKQRRLG